MEKKLIAVIGLGTFGYNVVKFLDSTDCDVLAIDESENRVQSVSEFCLHAVQANATDERVLKELGLVKYDVVIVGIGQNLEASILVTMLLKSMGVKHVITKALTPLHAKVLRRIGADRIIFPERDVAERLVNSVLSPNILDMIDISSEYNLVDIKVPKELTSKTLKEADLRSKFGVNIVAIRRNEPVIDDNGNTDFKEAMHISPESDFELEEGDVLIIIGKIVDIKKIEGLK